MSVEENKATIRRLVEEVWNNGDLSVIPELISPEFTSGRSSGQEGFKQFVTDSRKAFPDIHFTIDDMIGEGDKLVVRYTLRGTFKGEFAGVAPTGNQFNITNAWFYSFKDGKQLTALNFTDRKWFWEQLGASPPTN